MQIRSAVLAATTVVVALSVGACGGGGGHGNGVASLADAHTTTTVKKKSKAAAKQEMQDAALAFAKCMREHGVDMPDPTFDDNGGGFAIRQSGPAGGPNDATAQAAQQACQPIMDKAQQDMPRPSPEEEAKARDQALKFAKCMREHGIDMPDPTFDDQGHVRIQVHGSDAGTNVGGPDASKNGPNPKAPDSDPKFQAAANACGGLGGAKGGFSTSDKAP